MSIAYFLKGKLYLAIALVMSFIFLVVSLLFSLPVGATSTENMPAQTDFSNAGGTGQPGVRLVVSEISPGNSLKAPTSQVRVYSKQKNIQLQFEEWRHCSGNHDTNYVSTTKFEVYRTYSDESRASRAVSFNNGGQCAGNGTKVINVTAGQKSGEEGHADWYVLIVEATIGNGGVNSFKIKSPGNRIGYSKEAGERFAIQDRTRNTDTKMNATFHFAPPCDLSSAVPKTVSWSDDDYNGSPQSPFIGQLDAQLQRNGPGTNGWVNIVASFKNSGLFKGGGQQGSYQFTAQPGYKYRWIWKNVAKSNGIQFKLPFDSFWYDTTCPPQEAWRNTLSTSVNLTRVSFTKIAEPTVTKPTGYDIGMNCGAYYNGTSDEAKDRKKRCNDWNDYYQTNRDSAVDALHKVRFKHFVTNRAPAIDNKKHGATPGNSGGCSSSVSLSSYCARIQYRVYNQSANPQWSDWRWRFSNSSTTSSAAETSEDVRVNGYTSSLNKKQSRQVWRDVWNATDRPQGMPPATKNMTDESNTANQLHGLLKDPEQGDRYCERVVSKNPSSYNTHRIESNPKCVILSSGIDEGDPYWNLKPTTTVVDRVQQGANITPKADVFLPVTDNGYDNDDEIEEPGRNGDGPDGDDYTETAIDGEGKVGWQLSRFTLPANNNIEDLDDVQLQQIATNNLDGCAWVKSQAPIVNNCEQQASNPTNIKFQPNSAPTQLPASGSFAPHGTSSAPVGSQICYITSIYRPLMGHPGDVDGSGNINPNRAWRHSSVACATVVKSPKVQFLNGDVRAGRGFEGYDMSGMPNATVGACSPIASSQKALIVTSGSSSATDNRYGSWVEYGAFATDKIIGFGSAATSVGMSSNNRLTFGNTSNVASGFAAGGDFKFANCMPNYFGWVDATKANNVNGQASSLNVGNLSGNAQGQYVTTGQNATLNGASSLANKAILKVQKDGAGNGGNITINGNITFANGPHGSFNDLPQLIIIADGDIIINENVEQIDAWLIARGKINSCGNNVTPNASQCTKQLRINGPVAASRLNLYRTFGADLSNADASRPAELFTLNPAHLLKRYGPNDGNSTNPNATVLSEIELPPRY